MNPEGQGWIPAASTHATAGAGAGRQPPPDAQPAPDTVSALQVSPCAANVIVGLCGASEHATGPGDNPRTMGFTIPSPQLPQGCPRTAPMGLHPPSDTRATFCAWAQLQAFWPRDSRAVPSSQTFVRGAPQEQAHEVPPASGPSTSGVELPQPAGHDGRATGS